MADERLRQYKAAARNARRENRTLQTKSEKLETWLDRQVGRKRIDVNGIKNTAVPLFEDITIQRNALERAMADLLSIASY